MQSNSSLPSNETQRSDANSYATNTNLTYAMVFLRLFLELPVKFCHFSNRWNKFWCMYRASCTVYYPDQQIHNTYIL